MSKVTYGDVMDVEDDVNADDDDDADDNDDDGLTLISVTVTIARSKQLETLRRWMDTLAATSE
jgi:hypothetical protein